MKQLRKALLCALPLLAAGLPAAAQEGFQDPIDGSIRWLRSQQDPVAGSYGGGVEGTALTLRALAASPRRYRVADGPFVRRAADYLRSRQAEDGTIADDGCGADEALEQTRLAVLALLALEDPDLAGCAARGLARLGEGGAAGLEPAADPLTPEAARALGQGLLARRDERGAWPGPDGAVVETARAVRELSRAHSVLASQGGGPPPGTPSALPVFEPAAREAALKAMERGASFLLAVAEDGRWGMPGYADPGITAMVLSALAGLPEPRSEEVEEALDRGLTWLVSLQKEDGSIHDGRLANYVTSSAVLALVRAGREEHRPVVLRARAFLQALQADEGEGYSEGDRYYGGIGYGGDERPDLSNLQMALEAVAAAGLEQGDPTFTKALRFLERCQNRSESNDVRIADGEALIRSGDDGGAGYMPGDSKAGFVELADGTRIPRSYGSMTYALLKCYVFAGLERDDPRLQEAWKWCCENYTLDVNPGFDLLADPSAAYQGIFYYFHSLSRALEAYGEDTVVDAAGDEHDWRAELAGRLVAMQSRTDGSWVNRNSPRWWEGNPVLATAYALLSLDAALPDEGR